MKVKWSDRAVADLREIAGYIARNRPSAARNWTRALRARIRLLASTPRAGALVYGHELKGIRQIVFKNYRLYYRVDQDVVNILHLRDARRDLPEWIGERAVEYGVALPS